MQSCIKRKEKYSWRPKSGATRRLPFQLVQHRGEWEGTIPFPGTLHFILDTYLIVLSIK